MAVRWVLSQEVLEPHEDPDIVVGSQFDDVLPAALMRRRRSPVAREDPERHEGDMNGMGPVSAVILQIPDLRGALLRGRADLVGVKELLVDGPASIVITKHPPPGLD